MGGGGEHHACKGKENQRGELRRAAREAPGEFAGDDESEQTTQQEKGFEKTGKAVLDMAAVEADRSGVAQGHLGFGTSLVKRVGGDGLGMRTDNADVQWAGVALGDNSIAGRNGLGGAPTTEKEDA